MDIVTDIILPPKQLELVLSLTRAHLPGVEVWPTAPEFGATPAATPTWT